MDVKMDSNRGFDHGMFVPLKLIFPKADIPCVQLSLLQGLNPSSHIKMGQALAELRKENILVIGSGFTFHNMEAMMKSFSGDPGTKAVDERNVAFERWLEYVCTSDQLTEAERAEKLIHWDAVSNNNHGRYAHPREEHLLPLHVCYGLAEGSPTVATLAPSRPVRTFGNRRCKVRRREEEQKRVAECKFSQGLLARQRFHDEV